MFFAFSRGLAPSSRTSCLLHFRKSHRGIVFSPSNVRRQQSPAPAKSFFVEYLSAIQLPLNLKLVTPIPTPAQNSTPMVEKSLKGLKNIHSKVQLYISAYICFLKAVYKYILNDIYHSTCMWFPIKWGYQNIIKYLYLSGICVGKGNKDEVFR